MFISAYKRDSDESEYRSFMIKDDELLKNTIKFGKRLKILLIKNLIVILYTTKFI